MKTEQVKTVKIELNWDEIDKFKSALKKIEVENQKAGFNHIMNSDEKKLIEDLVKSLE